MDLAIAVLAAVSLVRAGWWLRREFRTVSVEWRVRRGLRAALAEVI